MTYSVSTDQKRPAQSAARAPYQAPTVTSLGAWNALTLAGSVQPMNDTFTHLLGKNTEA
jgi:hypothetical protein